MFDQLSELEDVIRKLEQMSSLFNCMCERYFDTREPDGRDLVASYGDHYIT